MKKVFANVLCYSILVILVFFCVGFFYNNGIKVCPSDVLKYKFNNGILLVLKVLPSAIITSFLIALSINFRSVQTNIKGRFSSVIFAQFRTVFICSLIFTFAITMIVEVFTPAIKSRKSNLEEKPVLIQSYLNLAEKNLIESLNNLELANLAYFYSKKVIEIEPQNNKAKELMNRAEMMLSKNTFANNNDILLEKETSKDGKKVFSNKQKKLDSNSSQTNQIENLTVYELVLKAEEKLENKEYLSAHYYAQYAVKMASERDINLERAKQCSNIAWNILSKVQAEELTEENRFFREKFRGYTKLNNGDFLAAYYIFQRLNNKSYEYENDPDVKYFLSESLKKVEGKYFFTDEINGKNSFEDCKDLYFSLKKQDGSYDIYSIKGITDIEDTGNYVRYLRNLYIYSFDKEGTYLYSMYVPSAKMLAVETNVIGDSKKQELGIDPKWKTVPYLLLCAVDRNEEGRKSVPSYKFGTVKNVIAQNQMFIPMLYDDFTALSNVNRSNDNINMLMMNKLKLKPADYGYSNEVVMQGTMLSIFYPFVILIILLLASSIAWNYRMMEIGLFKFVWIFIYPLINFIIFDVEIFAEFFIKLMNFIFIGIAGINFALYFGILFYIVCLIFVSLLFLSRKGD